MEPFKQLLSLIVVNTKIQMSRIEIITLFVMGFYIFCVEIDGRVVASCSEYQVKMIV